MIVMRHRRGSSFTSFQQEHQHHHLKFHSRFGLTHRASSRCRCMTIIFRFSAWKLPLCCRRQRQYLLLLLHHHLCMPLLKNLKRLTIMMMLILLFIYKFNNRILFFPLRYVMITILEESCCTVNINCLLDVNALPEPDGVLLFAWSSQSWSPEY